MQLAIQQHGLVTTRKGQGNPDLAALDPAGGPGILPLGAGRPVPLREDPRLVDDQDASRVGQVLLDVGNVIVADPIILSISAVEEMLDAVGSLVAG